jgi:chromosome segregation ATPase
MPPKFAHKDCREAHKDTRIAFLEAEGAELKRQRDTYRAYAERLDGEMAALRDAVSTAKLVGDLRARVADLEVALVDSVPRREMTVLVQRISDAEERYSVELAKRESAEAECARLREDIVRRKAMADDNHKTFMIQVEKIENLEAALAAAREEIKKLEDENDVHGQLIANMNSEHGVAKEMEACLWEIQQLEAALAARRADEPDPEWVRRAAEEIVR